MPAKQILVLTIPLFVTACQGTMSSSPTQSGASELDELAGSYCQDRYFSASASQRTRAQSVEQCDSQTQIAERIRRNEGRDRDLPFDSNESQ